jgi:hypothetical protein
MILSSQGDWATRKTFPAARVFSTLLESYQDSRLSTPYDEALEVRERHLDWQTMGNAEIVQTHQPLQRTAPAPWDGKCPAARPDWLSQAVDQRREQQRRNAEAETGAGWSTTFQGTGIEVRHRGITVPTNPLWILAVDTELIPSHSGISNPLVICLFNEFLGDPEVINRKGRQQEQRLRQR